MLPLEMRCIWHMPDWLVFRASHICEFTIIQHPVPQQPLLCLCFVMCAFLQETGQIYVLQLELCIYTLISCVPLQSKLDCWNPQWIQEILFTLRIMSCNSFPQDCLRVFQGFYSVSPRKFPVDVLTFAFLKFFSLGSDQ